MFQEKGQYKNFEGPRNRCAKHFEVIKNHLESAPQVLHKHQENMGVTREI
jgi:hypothetical protein